VSALPVVQAVVVCAGDEVSPLRETLDSLVAQDYPALQVLVVAPDADRDPGVGVTRVIRQAGTSLAGAFNQGAAADGGASVAYLLFCHDDVVLAPSAVRHLVEQSYRVNAGVVGPKYVDSADPEIITSLGETTDDLGFRAPRVDPGELDQQQHDGAREVASVTSGAMLVRRDLFEALNGFDPAMDGYGEDYDLCRRARYLGARVAVAPLARVAHRQLTARGQRVVAALSPRSRRLNNQLRTFAVVNDGPLAIVRRLKLTLILGCLFVAALVRRDAASRKELQSVVLGRRAQRGEERRRRSQLQRAARTLSGSTKGAEASKTSNAASVSTWRLVAPELRVWSARDDRERPVAVDELTASVFELGDRVADVAPVIRRDRLLLGLIALLQVIGSRDLIASGVSQLGTISILPDSIGSIFSAVILDAQDSAFSGVGGSSPVLYAIVPIVALLGGAATVALLVGLLIAGPLSVWGLAKRYLSAGGALIAAAAYAALPIGYNALNQGSLVMIVAYGLLPLFLSSMIKRSERSANHNRATIILWALLWLCLSPALVLPIVFVLSVLCVGSRRGDKAWVVRGRDVISYLIATAFASVAVSSWLVAGVRFGGLRELAFGAQRQPGTASSVGEILRLSVGSVNLTSVLATAILIAAMSGLLVGNETRFAMARRLWSWFVVSIATVVVIQRGYLPLGAESVAVLLVFAAIGLAIAVGVSHDTFTNDVVGSSFGLRHVVSFVSFGAALLAVVPSLGAATNGRWYSPVETVSSSLEWMPNATSDGDYRVMYIGDGSVIPSMPGGLRQIEPGLAVSFSVGGPASTTDVQLLRSTTNVTKVTDALSLTRDGLTRQLGSTLAQFSVRYVVVVGGEGAVDNGPRAVTPDGLTESLDAQVDLIGIQRSDAVDVFVNAAWTPSQVDTLVVATPLWYRVGNAMLLAVIVLAVAALARERRRTQASPAHALGSQSDFTIVGMSADDDRLVIDSDIDLRPDKDDRVVAVDTTTTTSAQEQ